MATIGNRRRTGSGPGAAPNWLVRASEIAGRSILVALAVLFVVLLLHRLRLIVFPVFVALLLTTALAPPAAWLRRHRWPPAATWAVLASPASFSSAVTGRWSRPQRSVKPRTTSNTGRSRGR